MTKRQFVTSPETSFAVSLGSCGCIFNDGWYSTLEKMFRSSDCEIETTHLKKVELKLTNIEQDNGILESEISKEKRRTRVTYQGTLILTF